MKCSGIDAPESAMPYGKEAKEALLKLVEGKCLTVHIYDTDRYGRSVGDLHAGGVFVQVRNYRMCIIFQKNILPRGSNLTSKKIRNTYSFLKT
jgi:hypothetical protein